MKHRWTTLLWELWAAQALCAVAALPPGMYGTHCPTACRRSSFWSRHRGSILPPCAILSGLLPCPEKRAKQKPLCREPGTEVLFVNQKAIKRSC